jgi:arylsulfatase
MDRVPWLPYSLDDRTGVEITDAFGDWHKKQNGEWAACLNYMDAHTPYVPRTEFSEFSTQAQREFAATLDYYVFGYVSGRRELSELHSLETVYDDCIKQADAEVGRLIRMLEQRGDLENTLVVVTADHGEGFGERGGLREIPSVGHGGTGGPEEGVLRVPLVVQFPGQTAERTVQEPASMMQFSDAVQSVLTGPWETDDFVPEGRTLATCQGLSKMEVESRGIEEQSFSKYDKTSRVAYEFDGGRLLKDAVYDGRGAAFDVTNPREVSRISRPDPIDIVNEQFSPLDSVEAIQRESERSVGESVKSRLEELGYR